MAEINVHILWTPPIARPWWRTDERCSELSPNDKVWTDCCGCKQPAHETECRAVASWDPPLGGAGCYQEPPLPWQPDRCEIEPGAPTGAYFDGRWETRCADGFGCTVNPRKKCGRELREYWRWG